MNMHTPNTNTQRGHILVVATLGLVVVAGGLLAWQYVRSRADPAPAAPQTAQPTAKTAAPADPTEGGKYFVIKEWDVRFPVPKTLRDDIKYGLFVFNDGGQAAYFTSKKVVAVAPGGTCDLKFEHTQYGEGISGGTFAISRLKTKPEKVDQRNFYSSGYWYGLEASSGGACYEGEDGAYRADFNQPLSQALKELQPLTD